MISAKRLDVFCSINKDNFLLPLVNIQRLRGKTLSLLWKEIAKYTMTTCRCKFGNSNMKQMGDFPKDRWNCYRDFLRKLIKLLKISEKCW